MSEGLRKGLATVAVAAGIWAVGRAALRARRRAEFQDQTALITGGSRGLGLVMARQLATEGARVILLARDAEELDRAKNDLSRLTANVDTRVCDVADRGTVEKTIHEVLSDHGNIDVVINNAGVIQAGPWDAMTEDDYREALATHVFAPMYVNAAVLPSMRARRRGRIVNIASIGGLISVPHLLPYGTSKFGLVGYSLGLRAELAREGIVVTTICPGLMRTGSPRNAYFKGRNEAEYTWFKLSSSLPLLTMSAEKAARQALDACRHGDALAVLGWPMKIAAALNGIAPSCMADFLGIVNRFLPDAPLSGTGKSLGSESETRLTRSPLTYLTDDAAAANNEIPGRAGA